MALNRTWTMDCDKCGINLTDSDGDVHGRVKEVEEKAELAGWSFASIGRPVAPGWYCGSCCDPVAANEARVLGTP